MKQSRILGVFFIISLAVSLLLMLNIPMWLSIRRGDVAALQSTDYLSLEDNMPVEGEICYVLGCAAAERNGIWSTELYGKSEKRYYVLWQPSGQMILYATNDAAEQSILEQITKETEAYAASAAVYQQSGDYEDLQPPVTRLQICGVVSRMTRDTEAQFSAWMRSGGGDGLGSANTTVYISHTGFRRYEVCAVGGIVLFAVSILLGCCAMAVRRKSAADQDFHMGKDV